MKESKPEQNRFTIAQHMLSNETVTKETTDA